MIFCAQISTLNKLMLFLIHSTIVQKGIFKFNFKQNLKHFDYWFQYFFLSNRLLSPVSDFARVTFIKNIKWMVKKKKILTTCLDSVHWILTGKRVFPVDNRYFFVENNRILGSSSLRYHCCLHPNFIFYFQQVISLNVPHDFWLLLFRFFFLYTQFLIPITEK